MSEVTWQRSFQIGRAKAGKKEPTKNKRLCSSMCIVWVEFHVKYNLVMVFPG